jgi:hypothetical protein
MRFLLLFLTIPYLMAEAAAPDCIRLKKIAEDLEKSIQSKRFGSNCDQLEAAKDFGLPKDFIGFDGKWDYRCKDFSSIDLQLKSVENEIALLKGIQSVKTEIKDGAETLKNTKNPNIAKEASENFIANLNIATSLELFLGTNTSGGENILSKMAKDPAGWVDMASFAGLIRKHCAEMDNQGDTVCKNFVLTPETYMELNDFVMIGKGTEKKFDKRQVRLLTDALYVQRGGSYPKSESKYSYRQLASELKGLQSNGVLSPEDLQKIKELTLIDSDPRFDFVQNLTKSMKDLKESEKLINVQNISGRFSGHLEDLKKRQEWELKSKLSLLLSKHNDLPESTSEKCLQARNLEVPIGECLDLIAKSDNLAQLDKSILSDLKEEFIYGEKQISSLSEQLKSCVPDASLNFAKECEGLITTQLSELMDKAQYLNALKAKHLQSSPDLISFRNYALEKLHSGQCMTSSETNIMECYQDIGPLSKEAVVLASEAKDIIHIFEKPKENTDISKICVESSEKVAFSSELCELADDDPTKKKKKVNPDTYQASVKPETRNRVTQDYVNFGTSVLQSLAGYMAPQPMMNTNPYTPIFPYTQPPMAYDISTQIMSPYVMNGFGNYFSTPGLRPYSSLNSSSTFAPYSFSGSSHFNSPVGW